MRKTQYLACVFIDFLFLMYVETKHRKYPSKAKLQKYTQMVDFQGNFW